MGRGKNLDIFYDIIYGWPHFSSNMTNRPVVPFNSHQQVLVLDESTCNSLWTIRNPKKSHPKPVKASNQETLILNWKHKKRDNRWEFPDLHNSHTKLWNLIRINLAVDFFEMPFAILQKLRKTFTDHDGKTTPI